MVPYKGALDSICPITHTPLNEIELAVAFRKNPIHPYECRALVLNTRRRDPITNLYVRWPYNGLEIIGPIDHWCRNPAEAAEMLRDELKYYEEVFILFSTSALMIERRAGQLAFLRCKWFWMYTICIISSACFRLMNKECPIVLDVDLCGAVNLATMFFGSYYTSTKFGQHSKRAGIINLAIAGFAKASNLGMLFILQCWPAANCSIPGNTMNLFFIKSIF